ncbi:MAG: endonuclease I family protein [Bacteroidia bacterium]
MKSVFIFFAGCLCFTLPAVSQSLLSLHNFQDSLTASSVATHLQVSPIGISSGSIAFQNGGDDGGSRIANSSNWPTVNFSPSGKYLEYSFSPQNGYVLQISELRFRFGRTTQGPQQITIAWSDDGFEEDTTYLLQNAPVVSTDANSLNSYSITTNLPASTTNTISIRIWGHNATGTGNLRFNNFRLFGQLNAPTPTLSVLPGQLSGFSTDSLSASTSQSFQLSGVGLVGNGNILLDGSGTAFELSSDNQSFSTTINIAHTPGNLSASTAWVRLKSGLDTGQYQQSIAISGGGAGSISLAVTGNVRLPAVPIQASIGGQLRLSADSLVFGTATELGLDSGFVKLYNDGGVLLEGRILSFASFNRPAFWTPDSSFSLAAGDSLEIKVFFRPWHNILNHGALLVDVRTGGGPQLIRLKGQGSYSMGYYASSQNLSGNDLLLALRNITGSPYQQLGYSTTNSARMRMFHIIDNWRVNGREPNHSQFYKNECIYTGRFISYDSPLSTGVLNNAPYRMNTEHSWPQSYGASEEPAKSDLHHLFPTDGPTNTARGNKHLGWVSNPTLFYDGGSKANTTTFEPRNEVKGQLARALLYYAMRYGDSAGTNMSLISAFENDLREWHQLYPPDSVEIRRNNDIQAVQLNRNPFVDYPQFLERLTQLSGTPAIPANYQLYVGDSLYAGEMAIGQSRTYRLPVINHGSVELSLSQIGVQGAGLQYSGPASISLGPGEAAFIEVQLQFNQSGQATGHLQFNSNDPGQPTRSIPLSAQVSRSSWNGEGVWGDATKWTAAFVPDSASFPRIASGRVQINDTIQISRLELAASSQLHIAENAFLFIGDSLVNEGVIRVQNAGTLYPADQAKITGSGAYEIIRTGQRSNLRVNYWSSPVQQAQLVDAFSAANPVDIQQFSPGGSQASHWQQATGVMTAGRGYSVAGADTAVFQGMVNHGEVVGAHNSGSGFYLIGNPYPAALDADAFLALNGPAGDGRIGGALYFWAQQTNATGSNFGSGDYAVWAGGTGVAGTGSNAGSSTPLGKIASAQGFFVVAGSQTGDIRFRPDMRGGRNNQFFRTSGPIGRIWLKVSSVQNGFSQMAIVMRHDASLAYDPAYDAERWTSGKLALSSRLRQQAFAIEAVAWPLAHQELVLPLELKLTETQQVVIGLDSLAGIDNSLRIVLEDRSRSAFFNLREQGMQLQLSPGTYQNRFFLHLGETVSLHLPGATQADTRLFAYEGHLYVEHAAGAELRLFNMAGQLLHTYRIEEATFSCELPEVSGIYVVQLQQADQIQRIRVHR